MGDLIRMPHSELHATIELLDSLGVTPKDFEELRKASSWRQRMTARVFKNDSAIFAVLELGDAVMRLGFKPGELRALASRGDLLQLVQKALLGDAAAQHIIDCDARPLDPWGLTFPVAPESDQLPGRVRGQFVFDPTKIKLHLSSNQQGGQYVKGDTLKVELANEPVLPANVLDFCLANPHLIPKVWKGKAVFFWGTIYRDSRGVLFVRDLYFRDGGWYSSCSRLGDDWSGGSPAALRAS